MAPIMKTLFRIPLAAALLVTGGVVLAGDVNPPVGPITPTGVTLAEIRASLDAIEDQALDAADTLVEIERPTPIEDLPSALGVDYVISQPGTYVLSGNHYGDGANTAIEVRVSGVVIDLRGFAIIGGGFFPGKGAYAIDTIGGVNNVTIFNGSIADFGDSSGGAIRLNGEGNVIVDVRVASSQGSGIRTGGNSTVLRSVVYNSASGISAGFASVIRDCAVQSVAGVGYTLDLGCVVENCTADQCGGDGYSASDAVVIEGCASSRNGGDGYDLFGAVVRQCTAYQNAGAGFRAFGSSAFACSASYNTGIGFDLSSGNHVTRCSATSNNVGGFRLTGIRNHVSSNYSGQHSTGFGFQVLPAATDCFVTANFATANSSYFDYQTTNGILGTRRVNLTNATIWDNFSN